MSTKKRGKKQGSKQQRRAKHQSPCPVEGGPVLGNFFAEGEVVILRGVFFRIYSLKGKRLHLEPISIPADLLAEVRAKVAAKRGAATGETGASVLSAPVGATLMRPVPQSKVQ